MHELQQILWVAGLGLAASLAVKMAVQRLFQTYIWFFFFLCFEIVRSLVLLPIAPNTTLYAWVFLATQPITWLIYILVVLELYSNTFSGYQGIASMSRWVVTGSLVAAVGISSVTLWADLARPTGRYKVLVYYSVVERGLVFSLVVFLLLITLFLVWFPISIRRNVFLHSSVYSLYFLSSTFTLFVRNIAGYQTTPAINTVLMFVDLVCFALWLTGFSKAGEVTMTTVRHSWQPNDEERLMQHLNALNASLLRHSDD